MNKKNQPQAEKIRVGIVLGGDINNYNNFALELAACDYVVCADGGAAHLSKINYLPDLLVGDFDSIDSQELESLTASGIPSRKFSPEKNQTDSELALESAIDFINMKTDKSDKTDKSGVSDQSDITICLLAATGSRPDHVLGNQLMAANMARKGYDVMMSDGVSRFYFMEGPAVRIFETNDYDYDFVVSAIAVSDQVSGLSYEGLKYPLDNYVLNFGSQRGISNCLKSFKDHGRNEFSVSIRSGTLMLIITPDR